MLKESRTHVKIQGALFRGANYTRVSWVHQFLTKLVVGVIAAFLLLLGSTSVIFGRLLVKIVVFNYVVYFNESLMKRVHA